MHSAVPLCEDCEEPIRRYVAGFSGSDVSEEVVACECSAVRLHYDDGDRPPADTVPDAWP